MNNENSSQPRFVKAVGFTIVEILVALAVTATSLGLAIALIPMFLSGHGPIVVANNINSMQVLREAIRSDLASSGGGEITTESASTLYVCRYSDDGTCITVNDDAFIPRFEPPQTQSMNEKYCISSSSTGQTTDGRSVIRIVMYRGKGLNLEYFYSENDWSQTFTDNGTTSDTGMIRKALRSICKATYDQTPGGFENAKWIKLNNPDVLQLESFMVCGVNNQVGFDSMTPKAPPAQCLKPLNQSGAINANCQSGENGLNSIMLYLKFNLSAQTSSGNGTESAASPSEIDVLLIPFSGKPCLDSGDAAT